MTRIARPLLILLLVVGAYLFGLLEGLERELMDLRARAFSRPADPALVLVEIDEPSLRAFPVWPWPRRLHAEALRRLANAGAGRVAFDVDFSSRSNPEDDGILAEAMRAAQAAGTEIILPVFRQPVRDAKGGRMFLESEPIAVFREHGVSAAFNVRPDSDGKVRRAFTRERWQERIVPHYAALVAGQQGGRLKDFYIDFSLNLVTIPRLRFADVVAGRFDPAAVRGRDILIGASALQLGDMVPVPLYRALPGIDVQALAYSSLATGRAMQRLNPAFIVALTLVILMTARFACAGRDWRVSLAAAGGIVTTASLGAFAVQLRYPFYIDLAPLIMVVAGDYLSDLVTRLRRQDILLLTQSLALRRRDMFMRLVVENSFDAIVTLQPDGKVLTYNHAAEGVFGYPRDEIVGGNVTGLLQDLKIARGESLETLLSLRGIHELCCRRGDGRPLVLDASIGQIRVGDESIIVFLARDITEKRDAEIQARRAEEHLAEAIESIDAGFALFGQDGLLLANRRYLNKTDLATKLGPNPSYAEIIHALATDGYFLGARDDAAAWTARRLARQDCDADAAIDQTADGRWILTSARRTHDGGLIVVETDISNLKEREAELIRARDQAEAANRTKTEFLAAMSHELRTPLNAIIGFSEVMTTEIFGPLGSENYTSYARDIHSSGQHLLAIINDILDMAKIEAGQFTLNEAPLSLAEAISGAARLLREKAEAKKIAVEVARPGAATGLMADARILRQILLNLLSNAIKFTPDGGSVGLAAEVRDDGSCAITISDTGIGMSHDDLIKALEPFGQAQSTLARQFEGTGLGLPLVDRFIHLHGGRLEIDSAPGEGTRATVIFPPARVLKSAAGKRNAARA